MGLSGGLVRRGHTAPARTPRSRARSPRTPSRPRTSSIPACVGPDPTSKTACTGASAENAPP
eukprot:255913-Rhodomonas_salina.1